MSMTYEVVDTFCVISEYDNGHIGVLGERAQYRCRDNRVIDDEIDVTICVNSDNLLSDINVKFTVSISHIKKKYGDYSKFKDMCKTLAKDKDEDIISDFNSKVRLFTNILYCLYGEKYVYEDEDEEE